MRNDIFEVIYMSKKENIKINYSKIAKQYNCDYRTVKAYYERDETVPLERKKRIIKSVLDDYKEIISDKYLNDKAPAIAIFNFLKQSKGYKGSYSTIKRYIHSLKEDKINEATERFEESLTKSGFTNIIKADSLESAIEEIKKNSRNYAKRQVTYIKHQFPVVFYENTDDLLRKLGKWKTF